MLAIVLPISLAILGIAFLLTLWRLVRGPSLPDRIVALDTLNINAIALIVVYGISLRSTVLFEVALLIAVIGVAGVLATILWGLSPLAVTPAAARETVAAADYAPGTIVIHTNERRLYYYLADGKALRYSAGHLR